MTLGTGPQALLEVLRDGWQASRTGRPDVPPLVPKGDERTENGVLLVRDRSDVRVQQDRHDLIHCYTPESDPGTTTDKGFDEQGVIDVVQIDIEVTDRTDATTGERLLARNRMVGERDKVAEPDDPPYPGIAGEVRYTLETVRRGFAEYDKVSYEPIRTMLNNSSADVSLSVDLEQIATNTVQ